jgi:hypothetical protein
MGIGDQDDVGSEGSLESCRATTSGAVRDEGNGRHDPYEGRMTMERVRYDLYIPQTTLLKTFASALNDF